MTPTSTDLSEFRLIRALRAGQPGAFPSLWNGVAGDVWSVLRAMVETDAEAVGWMNSFRVDLSERSASFVAGESLGPQVGQALVDHAARAFPAGPPMPGGPLAPDERGVRALPPAVRLRYLVDLFFDLPSEDPEVRRAYAMLEPSLDTDARMLVHAALLRSAPAQALLLPPGAEPPRRAVAPWLGLAAVVLTAITVVWAVWPRSWDYVDVHEGAWAATHGLLLGSEPDALSLAIVRAGAPGVLVDVPDLSRWGLNLLGAQVADGGVVLLYQGAEGEWTVHHVERGELPQGAPEATRGEVSVWVAGEWRLVGWSEGSTTWLLVSPADTERALAVGEGLREHRRHPVPPARSVFDAL